MIVKIFLFPFLLAKNCIGIFVGVIRFFFSLIMRIGGFGLGRVLGTVFGALIGAAGGRKHLRIKWFPQKK